VRLRGSVGDRCRPTLPAFLAAGLVVVLAVVAVGVGRAEGQPEPPGGSSTSTSTSTTTAAGGECVEIQRKRWAMPERITPPGHPDDYRSSAIPIMRPDYMVTYCRQGDDWVKTADALNYDDPNLCLDVIYPTNLPPPPDQIPTLAEIDDYGELGTGSGSAVGMQSYCRRGTTSWFRGPVGPPGAPTVPSPTDTPPGDYHEWSDTCLSIYVGSTAPPRHTRTPDQVGAIWDEENEDWDEPQLTFVDSNAIQLYCRKTGSQDWFLVADATLDQRVPGADVPTDAGNGTCVVFENTDRIDGADPPAVLTPGADPRDLGVVVSRSAYEQTYGDSYDMTRLMCFANGQWHRGDTLTSGCSGGIVLHTDSFLPSECWGRFPTGNYDIGYDEGAWNHFRRKIYGWWTDFFFNVSKGATQVSLFSIGWAYRFDIGQYRNFGLNVGENFRSNLTEAVFPVGAACRSDRGDEGPACPGGTFRLVDIGWLVLFGFVAINVLRRRAAMALGELVASVVLMTLCGLLILQRGAYMQSAWDLMDKATVDLLLVGNGRQPDGDEAAAADAVRQTQAAIHRAFVEQPYDHINWGHELTGPCAEARDRIVALGPHDADDYPRNQMGKAGCDAERDFNHDPNGTRMLAALLTATASIVVGFLLIAVGLTVVVAKFATLLLFALAPFAVLTVVLPGSGRRLFWLWAMAIAQAIAAVVGMAFLLALLLQSLTELFKLTGGVSMIERFMLLLLLVLLLAATRRRILSSTQSAAGRLADNLTNARVGGGGVPWQGPVGAQGLAFGGIDRTLTALGRSSLRAAGAGARIGTRVVAAPLAGGWRVLTANWNRHQNARLSLRNLRRMKRYDEAAGHATGTPLAFDRHRGVRRRHVRRTMTADRAGALAARARRRGLGLRTPRRRDRAEATYWDSVRTAFLADDPNATPGGRWRFRREVRAARRELWKQTGEHAPVFYLRTLRWPGATHHPGDGSGPAGGSGGGGMPPPPSPPPPPPPPSPPSSSPPPPAPAAPVADRGGPVRPPQVETLIRRGVAVRRDHVPSGDGAGTRPPLTPPGAAGTRSRTPPGGPTGG
jgi:hypothetical protein